MLAARIQRRPRTMSTIATVTVGSVPGSEADLEDAEAGFGEEGAEARAEEDEEEEAAEVGAGTGTGVEGVERTGEGVVIARKEEVGRAVCAGDVRAAVLDTPTTTVCCGLSSARRRRQLTFAAQ
jgi:hypothetical protein